MNSAETRTPFEEAIVGVHPRFGEAKVDIVCDGIVFARHRLHLPFGVEGVVESSRLTLDLSQNQFVEDEAWQIMTEWLIPGLVHRALLHFRKTNFQRFHDDIRRKEMQELACELELKLANTPYDWVRAQQRAWGVEELIEDTFELRETLRGHPMWSSAYQLAPDVTLRDILECDELQFSSVQTSEQPPKRGPLVLHFPRGLPRGFAQLVDGKLEDMTPNFRKKRRL